MSKNRFGAPVARAIAAAFGFISALALSSAPAVAAKNVVTYHYDNQRTGWNNAEPYLSPATLQHGRNGKSFQMIHSVALDDQVDTQPLLLTNQDIADKGVRNVVYVATENNSIYAIDANTGEILLQRNFGPPVPIDALPGGCNNNADNVGIGGTPAIDRSTGWMYFIADTYYNNVPRYYLYVVDVSTLNEVVPRVQVTASGLLTNGQTYNFRAGASRQRAALLLSGANLYAGFASFCDVDANLSRGWVLGWNKTSLAPLRANELTNLLSHSPDNFFLTSVWMSGYGLASQPNGDIYFVTGNSDYSGTTIDSVNNVAESAVQISHDLKTVKSVFTPDNAVDLENGDADFGSGGLMLLPPQSGAGSDLAVAAGKDGNLYLLNADNLNNNTTGDQRILGTYYIGGCWCGASYFTASTGAGVVVTSGGNNVQTWRVHPAARSSLVFLNQSDSIAGAQDPGFFTSVSSNGTQPNTAVIWAVSRPDGSDAENVMLYAFDAKTDATLYSAVAGTWPNTGGNSNLVPVVANGKVYVASYKSLAIFGFGAGTPATLPAVALAPVAAARAALPPNQHEIFGIVRAMNGDRLTVARRDGRLITVDTAPARQALAYAEPTVGHGVLVRGTLSLEGVMTATTVLHAKTNPKMWPQDR